MFWLNLIVQPHFAIFMKRKSWQRDFWQGLCLGRSQCLHDPMHILVLIVWWMAGGLVGKQLSSAMKLLLHVIRNHSSFASSRFRTSWNNTTRWNSKTVKSRFAWRLRVESRVHVHVRHLLHGLQSWQARGEHWGTDGFQNSIMRRQGEFNPNDRSALVPAWRLS